MDLLSLIPRVGYHEAARSAVPAGHDPDTAGRLALEAVRIAPLQRVQTSLDQLARNVEDGLRREHPRLDAGYVEDELAHARRLRDTLRAAADAADAMIRDVEGGIDRLKAAMAPKRNARRAATTED